MKKIIFLCTSLCTFLVYSQQEYKIGVLLFREEMGNLPTQNITGKTLDSIVASISANVPNRTSGSGTRLKKVKLVIELEIPWSNTETSQGNYNFEWYKEFATLCENKGIKWTTLLSPHYVPTFYDSQYSVDKLKYLDGTNYPSFNFLQFSPNSSIWNDKVANWIQAFVHQMYTSNHFYSTSYQNRAIEELLVGNEMIYPFNEAISGDAATKAKWNQENPTVAYPSNLGEFLSFWNNSTLTSNLLKDFRNRHLTYCIAGMIHEAKTQLITDLGTDNANNIGVSSKLVSYIFPRADISISDEIQGYDNAQLGYLINQSNKFLAIDSYTNPNGWDLLNDYNTTNVRTSASGKSIYLAEFNRVNGAIPFVATDFSNFLTSFPNIKYYVFFAWNPNGSDSHYKITEGQQLGLYNMLNTIVPRTNPIEASIIKPNNFASGAFTISTPTSFNNSNLSISNNDVDWYKFVYSSKTYYLKVIQKSNGTNSSAYGLSLKIDSCNSDIILTANTYGSIPLYTKIFLYNANLFELTNNDDYNGINTFSKLFYNLNDANNNYVVNRLITNQNTFIPENDISINKVQKNQEDMQPLEVTISPNPAQKFIDIMINGTNEKYNLTIYDINSNSVYNESQISSKSIKQVDVSSFKKGIYFIQVITNTDKTVKKMIKIE